MAICLEKANTKTVIAIATEEISTKTVLKYCQASSGLPAPRAFPIKVEIEHAIPYGNM